MLENTEMIYTAIFQNSQGKLNTSRYTGVMDRTAAWLSAAQMGGTAGECLIALVPGDHPVYFYENFVIDSDQKKNRTQQQDHDLYLISE